MTDRELKIWNELKVDPIWRFKTDEELKKILQGIIEEGNLLVAFADDRTNVDFINQFEVGLFFVNKIALGGLYFSLQILAQLKIADYKKQSDMPAYFNLSENTYYKLRNKLELLGFIRLEKTGRNVVIRFNRVLRLIDFKLPADTSEYFTYLKKQQKLIITVTPEYDKEQEDIQKHLQTQVQLNGLIKHEASKIVEKKEAQKKRAEEKFSSEDYILVLDAFKKYKKIGLLGPEVNRAKHAIKQMFLAQRSVKQIIDCIKFFSEHQKEDNFKWMQNWTLETVMKKMPEFVAGALKSSKIGDDIPDY